MTNKYHYTECGLDNVWLTNGFELVDLPSGRHLKIKDVEGLHREIGRALVCQKKNLSGKEIRFLRHEMLLSQASLAKLLQVTEQTVHRWETGKADIPKPAESFIRLMYRELIKDDSNIGIKAALEKLAALEDTIDGSKWTATKKQNNKPWQMTLDLAA